MERHFLCDRVDHILLVQGPAVAIDTLCQLKWGLACSSLAVNKMAPEWLQKIKRWPLETTLNFAGFHWLSYPSKKPGFKTSHKDRANLNLLFGPSLKWHFNFGHCHWAFAKGHLFGYCKSLCYGFSAIINQPGIKIPFCSVHSYTIGSHVVISLCGHYYVHLYAVKKYLNCQEKIASGQEGQ